MGVFQKPEQAFKKLFLEHIKDQRKEGDIDGLLGLREFEDSLAFLIDPYSTISEFQGTLHKKNELEDMDEIICQDVTLPFAIIGEMRKKTELLPNSTSVEQAECAKHYEDTLDLLLNTIHHYYSLKAKFKYNALINSFHFEGKETLEQFRQKIQTEDAFQILSFPKNIRYHTQNIEQALLLPSFIELNASQCLKHMRCLLGIRKVFLDYLLTLFLILQKVDDRRENELHGTHCITRILLLFSPLLHVIQEQIKALMIIHRQKLKDNYSPVGTEKQSDLEVWFDTLDILFESNAQMRKLKLYINALRDGDLHAWAKLMNQRFQDCPEVLKEINEILQAPLDYQGIHNFAINAFQSSPQIQQQIIKGMKVIEYMQDRYNKWVYSMNGALGESHSIQFADVYDLFHTLQEGREGSRFIQGDEKIFLKPRPNHKSEIDSLVDISDAKKEKFLEMVWIATQKKSYIKCIAKQFYYLKKPQLFSKTLNYFSGRKSQSEMLNMVFTCFSEVEPKPQKVTQQQKKKERYEKNIAHLRKTRVSLKEKTVFSEEYVQIQKAHKNIAKQKETYKWVNRLTGKDLLEYLAERRSLFRHHLAELREKRAEMSEKQLKVSESTEVFMEAEINVHDSLHTEPSPSSETANIVLGKTDIDKFENETLESLKGYSNSCVAQGQYKQEYFENRQNEIKGILQSLKEQAEQSSEGGEMMHTMESVHHIMADVGQVMHDLSEELPENAGEKLKILLQEEEDTFNALMEKEFSFEVRGKDAHYQLKSFIILPIPAKQKVMALQLLNFDKENSITQKDFRALENFLHSRSNFTTSDPFEIVKDKSVQLIKLSNYLWFDALLYQAVPFGFEQDAEPISLLDLYSLPLESEEDNKFAQHTRLIEKILKEAKNEKMDQEIRERIIRDIKNKNFINNIAHQLQHKYHDSTHNLFPEGHLDQTVLKTVIQWYRVRKEDQAMNYYKLNRNTSQK